MHFTDTNFISSIHCKVLNANDNGALKIHNNQSTHMHPEHMFINLQRSFTDMLPQLSKQSNWIMREEKTIELMKNLLKYLASMCVFLRMLVDFKMNFQIGIRLSNKTHFFFIFNETFHSSTMEWIWKTKYNS